MKLDCKGPNYGPPSFFINSVFILLSFLSFFIKMPLNRGGGPQPRGRCANPEEFVLRALRHHAS